jgi:hypothetical protein
MRNGNEDRVDIPIPPDVAERLQQWRRLWTNAAHGHYYVGVASVAASTLAAVIGGFHAPTGQVLAGIGAVLTAAIGFLKPEQKYVKFVRAWRILDVAVMKYRAGIIDREALINAVAEGEASITRVEEDDLSNGIKPANKGPKDHGAPQPVKPGPVDTGYESRKT